MNTITVAKDNSATNPKENQWAKAKMEHSHCTKLGNQPMDKEDICIHGIMILRYCGSVAIHVCILLLTVFVVCHCNASKSVV